MKHQLDSEGGKATARELAARSGVAPERAVRVNEAMAEVEKVRESRESAADKRSTRVSTTDPEARVMKTAAGGWRPADNVQFATDVGSRVIAGVSVTKKGNDQGQIAPMLAEIGRHTERGTVVGDRLQRDALGRTRCSVAQIGAAAGRSGAAAPRAPENGAESNFGWSATRASDR